MKTADSLDELVGEQMLWSDGEQLHFQHALAKDAIYQNISLWRRRLLHKRAAHIMAKWPGANKELAVIAYHFEEAGEVMSAIDYYRRAATADAAIYAHQAAVDHLDRALSLVGQTPEAAADLPEIYEMLGDNLAILGNFTRAEATYRMLLTTIPPRDQLRLAATAGKLARTLPFQQRAIEAEQIYRLALARLETGVSPDESAILSVRLTILLGLLDAIYHQFKPEAMADLQGETEKLLTAAGTLEQQVGYYHSLNQRTFLQYGFRSPPENIDRANITLALAYESGNRRLIGRQCFHLGFHSLWSAKFGDAEENLRRALETAEEVGDSWLYVQSLVYLSITYRLKGDANRLQKILPALSAQTKEAGYSTYIAVDHAQRAWGHFRAGQWSQARSEAQTAQSIWANALAPYPFEWLANWILLAQALQERRLTEAVAAARAMLLPKQQKFSNEIEEALQSADSAWEADDVAGARDALETAVGLAHARSYL